MNLQRGRLLAPLLVAAACGCTHVGLPGDASPLTGIERTLELTPMRPAWRRNLDVGALSQESGNELASPGYDAVGGRVAVGPGDGWFYLLRASDGAVLWRKPIGGSSGRPVFDRDRVITGTTDGELIAFDVRTGERAWSYSVQGIIDRPPLLVGDLVYFVDGMNGVYALERRSGAWKWQYRRERPADFALLGESGPAYADGRVYVGFSDGQLAALDATTGAVVWTRDLSPEHDKFQDVDTTPVVRDGVVYAASAAAGLYALNAETGDIVWTQALSGVNRLRAIDDDLLLSLDRGQVMRVARRDGAIRWQARFSKAAGAPSQPEVVNGLVAVSLSRGPLVLLDARTGRPVQHFDPGSGVYAAPAAGPDGSLYVLSNGGILYAMRATAPVRSPDQVIEPVI